MNVGREIVERRNYRLTAKIAGNANAGRGLTGASKNEGQSAQPDGAKSMNKAEVEDDRRWAPRWGLEIDATVTDTAGWSYAAKVTDLSVEGCSVRLALGCDLVRDRLHTIKITGLEPLTAYVIWASEGKAGLVLAEPLHPDLVQNLVLKSAYVRLGRQRENSDQPRKRPQNLSKFPFD